MLIENTVNIRHLSYIRVFQGADKVMSLLGRVVTNNIVIIPPPPASQAEVSTDVPGTGPGTGPGPH